MVFFTGATSRVGGPWRCSTLRWCLKNDTSLIVVSMRSTLPRLSYILIEPLPKRCLMQVPSMRVGTASRSPGQRGVICRPRKLATCSAFTSRSPGEPVAHKPGQCGRGTQHQIHRVFHLHQAPVVAARNLQQPDNTAWHSDPDARCN